MDGIKDLRLSGVLTTWYNNNKRSLPWRDTADPYVIWLSEVILQQTRVEQGYNYFVRFTERFPSIADLANANEDEVLKLWQGLGYYSRARNLHAAARMVMTNFEGVFPSNYKDILSLKGIGEYTAAAIASFSYGQPYAVVDGNVYRVLARIFAIDTPIDTTQGKKDFALLAQVLLDEHNAGLHNQAIMEFGALQCVPVSPDCNICPAMDMCMAYAENKVSAYPRKQGKTKVRHRYFNYLDIHEGDDRFLNKRAERDIWQGLYEFPLIMTDEKVDLEYLIALPAFHGLLGNATLKHISLEVQYKHVLSHQIIHAAFYRLAVANFDSKDYLRIGTGKVGEYAVSRLVERYLDK